MPRVRSRRIMALLALVLVVALAAVGSMVMTYDGGGDGGGAPAGETHFGW